MRVPYGVLGAGRQGTAAAYDLARFCREGEVLLADVDGEAARRAVERVNRLLGRPGVKARRVDATQGGEVDAFLKAVRVCASAVPYYLNFDLASRAVAHGCCFCDLGGNAEVVRQELELDGKAKEAGVTLVPDCGVGPGLISNLAYLAFRQFEEAEEILVYDGGLPQNPRPPFHYLCFFNLEGLTNEYAGEALYLQEGDIRPVPCFAPEKLEVVEIPRLGKLEAFVTSGGLTTLVRTLRGRVRTLENKTLRYPGHYQLFKNLSDLGLLQTEPISVKGRPVVPRDFLHAILARHFTPGPQDRDLMVIHIRARGRYRGRLRKVTVDLLDFFDEESGFSAMERTTGFHLGMVAQRLSQEEAPKGAVPPELILDPEHLLEGLAERGLQAVLSVHDGEERV